MSATPRVTVVVPTLDARDLVEAALATLAAQTYRDHRVVVVDDGSSDGTAEAVRERWPGTVVARHAVNRGVAAALNRGVAEANGSELVALLNNDVELDPAWLERLVACLDAHPDAVAATGKLRSFHERSRIDAAGDWLLSSTAVVNRGHGETDHGQYDTPQAVFGACAGATLYRASALADVGPFDERLGTYLEDVDWSVRARLRGHEVRYEPAAVGFHMGGATTGRQATRFRGLQVRNQLLIALKSLPARSLVRHAPAIAVHHLLWLAASTRDGDGAAHLRAWWALVRALPQTLRARRAIQRRRTISGEELEALMRAGIPADATGLERRLFTLAPATFQRRRRT